MDYIKHSSIRFAKETKLYGKTITFEKLLFAARQKGYIVRKYSTSADTMILYRVFERAKKSSSISITDNDSNTVIFIDDSLPKLKQLFALAHEIGHINLGHSPGSPKKRRQEREANLFAHYLIDLEFDNKRIKFAIKVISVCLCLCLSALFIFAHHLNNPTQARTVSSNSEQTIERTFEVPKETVCYYTKYGEVYHLYKDCYYIKTSKNVFCDTVENCHKDRLCSACEQRLNNE